MFQITVLATRQNGIDDYGFCCDVECVWDDVEFVNVVRK